jgi:hypothetical protein
MSCATREGRASGSQPASRHPLAATAGSGPAGSEPTLPPWFIQRSSSTRAAVRASSATGRVRCPPAIARRVVGATSSAAHWAPQRQHASCWRPIGAWQERHKRARCRSRMAQRSFPRADRRSRGVRHSNRRTALPSLRGETVSQVTARHPAGRCPARSRFAGAVKWPLGHCIPFRAYARTFSLSRGVCRALTGASMRRIAEPHGAEHSARRQGGFSGRVSRANY